MPSAQPEPLLDTLKRAAAALRDADIPFALAGGVAVWARGGPPSEKDIDLFIRAEDSERARLAMEAAGLRTESPPEGWLVKAWDGDVLVDLIFAPTGYLVDDEVLARCEELRVTAVPMRVMPAEDILVSKLLALTEHHLDFGPALQIARALREQIRWPSVRERTAESPFARAFLVLVTELGVADASGEGESAAPVVSPPLEHVLLHVREQLAEDARVGELGLRAEAVLEGDTAVIVLQGVVSTEARKQGVVEVTRDVLARHRVTAHIDDRTTVAAAPVPDGSMERL